MDLNTVMLKHTSGAFKYLPGYPDANDILYMISTSKKKSITKEEIGKLAGVDTKLLVEGLSVLTDSGAIAAVEGGYNICDNEKMEYIKNNGK